ASITVDGKRKYLGSFKLLDDAKQARKEANALYGFHENHGRSQ
ncbi:HNH endonuclease, partial [Salmonella enterica]|nr:HNH endonuclease [Salmonella enterica]EAT9844430.1 HNH endonuclease [Salmonella enterica]EBG0931513.1 HNH endonuclease [Salmonella enterica]EBG8847308.1 HNH endonuclease [Salmonella enterica]EBH0554744.1 HNH endonuclease [Salmonella enterica]